VRRTPLFLALATGASMTLAAATPAGAAPSPAPAPVPSALAATAADRLVGNAASAAVLHRADGDALHRTGVVAGTRGLQYVTYARTYRGLPVVGGDVVVTTDASGAVKGTAVAQSAEIAVGTAAKVTAARAATTAKAQLAQVDSASAATLKVLAWGTPALVYETAVEGRTAAGRPSNLHVFVDAVTGEVVDSVDYVREGTGNGYYYGTVTINTSGSGSSYSMTDSTRPGLRCGGQNGSAYTGTDDVWGNGSGTNLETACVDALWGAQREVDMLGAWFGRRGINGNGNNPPIRVGLADVNAYWNGSYVNFGHNQANNRQATPIDVVGHELGHAIFQNTPGGAGSGNENGGINESTGDIFGALTEAYANSPLDPPDYTVGEEVDLVGDGPIRYMYHPSLAGDPNCWSSSIPSTEVHSAAGPLNHWFYLAAEGSAPSGKPASPTCNSSSVTGVGIRKAGEIYYNALQAKTSTWRYANIRTATLNAAKNLYSPSCTEFTAVKAAWNAISVPAQSNEPTCTGGGGGDPEPPAGCSGTNGADVTIPDAGSAVTSSITISGCARNATAASTVAVDITHTWRGDLVVDLLAPDGSAYRLKNSSSSDSADNVRTTYTVNLSSEAANGTWRLQARDVYRQDTGYINSWTLTV
jgi:Zn-dependent metalloprotease